MLTRNLPPQPQAPHPCYTPPGRALQAALQQCVATRSQHTADFVGCQNELVTLQQANHSSALMLADCSAHLAECDRRLDACFAQAQP